MSIDSASSQAQTILYLHSSDDLYGADRILLEIVCGLDRSRFTPIVILPDDMRHIGLLSAQLSAHRIEWLHLPIAIVRRRYFTPLGMAVFLSRLVRGTWAVRKIACTRQVRLIHGFTLAVAAAPVAAIVLRLPLIMHAHEILLRPRIVRKLLHIVGVRWSNRVLCVSQATRENIIEDQPAASARLRVVRNGIRRPKRSQLSVLGIRDKLGVPKDIPLVGMLGRVSAWKGQEVFLEAAAIVSSQRKDCHFIAIGGVFDGDTRPLERLQRLHQSLKLQSVATLRDFIPDAREMLTAFDIFVLPSTAPEPFGTVILEAMSAELPVIASAHGGSLEVVVDGVTGLLVTPGDARSLALAIQALLDDPARRRRMGEAGLRRMVENFELQAYLAAIEQVYAEVSAEVPFVTT